MENTKTGERRVLSIAPAKFGSKRSYPPSTPGANFGEPFCCSTGATETYISDISTVAIRQDGCHPMILQPPTTTISTRISCRAAGSMVHPRPTAITPRTPRQAHPRIKAGVFSRNLKGRRLQRHQPSQLSDLVSSTHCRSCQLVLP